MGTCPWTGITLQAGVTGIYFSITQLPPPAAMPPLVQRPVQNPARSYQLSQILLYQLDTKTFYYYNATWTAVKTASQWKRINSSVDFKAIFHRQELQELPSIAPSLRAAVSQGNVPRLEWHLCFYRHLKVEGTFIQLLQFSYLFPGKGSLMWIHQYLHSNWMQPSCHLLKRRTADWKN